MEKHISGRENVKAQTQEKVWISKRWGVVRITEVQGRWSEVKEKATESWEK